MDDQTRDAIQAAAFRRLTALLRHRTDVQNIDLMGTGGFCRNCLSDWLADEAAERDVVLTKDDARAMVYGMPYADYKVRHQTDATPEQLERMKASVAKNRTLDAALPTASPQATRRARASREASR